MDFAFMGGSMGSVVGEKLTRAADSAVERKVPLVAVTASGGARMQEGILSLMQLPKTVCAIEDLRDARCGFISVMTHPTTAGVLASFASLGDVIVSEPGALLAFTGPRVVQQTTREKLPEDFGLAESNLRFGHLDAILPSDRAPALPRPRSATLLPMAGEDERHLRERLNRLRGVPLLRGTRLSGDAEAAAEAARAHRGRAVGRGDLALGRPRAPLPAPVHARLRGAALRGLRRAARRPGARRGPCARDRPRRASAAGRSRSSASRRAATSTSARAATSGWRTRRATARACG